MKVEPAAADLLEIARAAILAEVAPALDGPQRYAALMAANALAIAARELAAPDGSAAERGRLAALLPDWRVPQDEARALREGTARLAARVREGLFDAGAPRAALLAHLRDTVHWRLAVSSPRALSRNDRSAP